MASLGTPNRVTRFTHFEIWIVLEAFSTTSSHNCLHAETCDSFGRLVARAANQGGGPPNQFSDVAQSSGETGQRLEGSGADHWVDVWAHPFAHRLGDALIGRSMRTDLSSDFAYRGWKVHVEVNGTDATFSGHADLCLSGAMKCRLVLASSHDDRTARLTLDAKARDYIDHHWFSSLGASSEDFTDTDFGELGRE